MNQRYSFWLLFLALACSGPTRAQEHTFTLHGIAGETVPITEGKMTNLIFPTGIRTGVKVSSDIKAQKVKGVENVIELKAARKNFPPTNLSVYGLNGQLYSIDLVYSDSPTVLNFRVIDTIPPAQYHPRPHTAPILLTDLPIDQTTLSQDAATLSIKKGFLHKSVSSERLRLALRTIYLKDSLLWLTFQIRNQSMITYKPEYLRFSIQDKHKLKRTAAQSQEQTPILWNLPPTIPGHHTQTFAVGFTPFTIPKGKKLTIHLAEQGGGRVLILSIKAKTLLKAKAMGP